MTSAAAGLQLERAIEVRLSRQDMLTSGDREVFCIPGEPARRFVQHQRA
ncbi:hypothetical protein [Streptomyces sp. Je 1-369]|nr:hypothetical protein [Streptomyces sp. Je 1-369]WAL95436.1 hypothetical protein NOO62_13600 [Streptomyces sp. Je 1-369]